MQTINIIVGEPNQKINLGRRGEYDVTEVIFDITSFVEEYGDGNVVLLAKRANDLDPYPVATSRENNKVTWLVNNADTQYVGQGKAEIFWYVGENLDKLAKSEVYQTWVCADIGETTTEPPEPQEGWVEQVIEAVNEIAQEAKGYADDSKDYADESKGYAENAAESAQEAQTILNRTIYIGDDGNFYINN